MSTVNGFQVGSETLKYNYESLDNYNTPNFSTSSSKTYTVGDYVMYNGKLYKCTVATTGGTWVSGSWTLAVLSDDVSDLNRQLSDVEDALEDNTVSNGQLINPATVGVFNGYINGSGVLKSSSSFRTLYYPCEENTDYAVSAINIPDGNARNVLLLSTVPSADATGLFLGGIITNHLLLNSREYNYICVTFYNRSLDTMTIAQALESIKIQLGTNATEGFGYGDRVPIVTVGGLTDTLTRDREQNNSIAKQFADFSGNIQSGINIADPQKVVTGFYITAGGTLSPNNNYKAFENLAIEPSTNYAVSQSGSNYNNNVYAFFDVNNIWISQVSGGNTFITPANAKYLSVSMSIAATNISIVAGEIAISSEYWEKINSNFIQTPRKGTVLTAHSDELTSNDSLSIVIPDIKKNSVYGLHMNVTTMGTFTFGPGRNKVNRSAFVTIDATNITVHYYTASSTQTLKTYTHGLTISNELDLVIKQANDSFSEATIRLSSSGVSYKVPELVYWKGNDTPLTLAINNGTYTDVDMNYYCTDYTKDLYIFGDSYLDHWPRYVMNTAQNNYQNYLLDGFGGRNSLDAVASLRNIEAVHGIPKKLFWCMGMNDGDSGAINANWMKALNTVVDYCNQYNVELILCTIPNVATVDNTYKNTYIRSSGYRYVDLAKAVGSDVSTSWFTGLLSSDGVHPSTAGDKMIADFMISQVPEMI